MRRVLIISTLAVTLLLTLPMASEARVGWGPRGGVTMDPDQVHLGLHVSTDYLSQRLRFQPNFELGLEDDMTVAAFNFESLYVLGSATAEWHPYLGGGVGVFMIDDDRFRSNDTEAGVSALLGVENHVGGNGKVFTEWKVGFVDAPDFKWTLGYTFLH